MSNLKQTHESLTDFYKSYISGINTYASSSSPSSSSSSPASPSLNGFSAYLSPTITHNDRALTQDQYHALILPKSVFHIESITTDPVAGGIGARLTIVLEDKKVVREHVFYHVGEDGIDTVWSMVEGL